MAFQAIRSMAANDRPGANDGSIELPPQPTTDGPPIPLPQVPGTSDYMTRHNKQAGRIRAALAANPRQRIDGVMAYNPNQRTWAVPRRDPYVANQVPAGGNGPVALAFNGANPATTVSATGSNAQPNTVSRPNSGYDPDKPYWQAGGN